MTEPSLLKQLFALASDKRLALLSVLANANELLSTSALAALCDMTVSLASRHLKNLEEAGLTTSAQSGPYTLHALKRDSVKETIEALSSLLRKDALDATEEQRLDESPTNEVSRDSKEEENPQAQNN